MRQIAAFILYWFLRIFWRLKWIKDEKEHESGWYLVKRRWVWFLISPLVLAWLFMYTAWAFYWSLGNYTMHWVQEDKPVKLSADEYKSIFTSLMS